MKKINTLAFFLLMLFYSAGQSLQFKENKGQWPDHVLFGTEYANFKCWFTQKGFRYSIYNPEELSAAFASAKKREPNAQKVHGHTYETEFTGADFSHFSTEKKSKEYFNYFLGKDPSKWASEVYGFGKVNYNEILPGINLVCHSENSSFKYDLQLDAGASLAALNIKYKYVDELSLQEGDLIIRTSAGMVREKKPLAWQVINGTKKIVPCQYILRPDHSIGFSAIYDHSKELIIDPVVLACTYSGADTWSYGIACTYDSGGNIYSAVWADYGYPTTNGAFTVTGNVITDGVITAYNSNASAILFSTYIGGDSLEFPVSIKVSNNEIILAGFTESPDFPVTTGVFDNTLDGKSDLFISKLNMTGTTLNASTFVGGSATESEPMLAISSFGWMTGTEMWADNSGQVFVASCTTSPNFPTTPGAHSSVLNGTSDAVFFAMNSNLSALNWSTYIGGSLKDDGSGIRPDGQGGAYCMGSTNSTNFPASPGAFKTTYSPGQGADIYVSHLSATGTILNATYYGTAGNDLGYYLDLDQNHDVYFCGHIDLTSLFTASPGTYSNNNGENIIARLDSSLGSLVFQTKFGSTSNTSFPKLYFTTLKVDSCGNIYTSGTAYKFFPVTPNAFMGYQGGYTDIWIGVFNPNCSSLRFGSYYGGSGGPPTGFNNVGDQNWGTCHVDDNGIMYLALAATTGFPTLPGAMDSTYSNTTSSPVIYNDLVMKIDLQTFLTASTSYGPTLTGCIPFTGEFVSAWGNGSVYWDFFDGTTSTQDSVTHSYPNLGTYDVLLVITDSSTCNKTDSVLSQVQVIDQTLLDLGPDVYLCGDSQLILQSPVSAQSYSWSTGSLYPSTLVTNPGIVSLTINNGGCDTKDSLLVTEVFPLVPEKFPNVVTPNNDSINEFIDLAAYDFSEMKLLIYNRWGQVVYETENTTARWSPGQEVAEGTYYYVLEYSSRCSGEVRKEKGFISVFR